MSICECVYFVEACVHLCTIDFLSLFFPTQLYITILFIRKNDNSGVQRDSRVIAIIIYPIHTHFAILGFPLGSFDRAHHHYCTLFGRQTHTSFNIYYLHKHSSNVKVSSILVTHSPKGRGLVAHWYHLLCSKSILIVPLPIFTFLHPPGRKFETILILLVWNRRQKIGMV